jgi:hypothetical protein
MSAAPQIGSGRLVAGFAAGAAIPILMFVVVFWPTWQAVVLVGIFLAAVALALVGLPAYLLLRRFNLLNVYSAALLGGFLCTLPLYYFSIENALTTHSMTRDTTQLIVDGRLTFQGFLHLFVYDPLWLFIPGAVGGIVGWLVAAGFRIRAT